MPPKGWRKPKPELSAQKERALLLEKSGLDVDAKAILLASALDAVRAGLASSDLADRLRAASMALGLLGVKPSRNPMAPTPAKEQGAEPEEDDWSATPASVAPAKPSLRGPVEPEVLGD